MQKVRGGRVADAASGEFGKLSDLLNEDFARASQRAVIGAQPSQGRAGLGVAHRAFGAELFDGVGTLAQGFGQWHAFGHQVQDQVLDGGAVAGYAPGVIER